MEEGGGGQAGGRCYSREKAAGNDKGCKYLPLPGPGSCAELTGSLLGCTRMGGGVEGPGAEGKKVGAKG